jgi:predicted AAA+ superfamily ATPase
VGKTTLVRAAAPGLPYVSLDDLTALSAARQDPQSFLKGLPRPLILDEVQRAPELLLAVKQAVDKDRKPGSFLLTGSTSVRTRSKVRESLAGRAAVLRLWPMTLPELEGRPAWNPLPLLETTQDVAALLSVFPVRGNEGLPEKVLAGGFPEPSATLPLEGRAAWFEQYRRTYVERDVPELVQVEEVPAFLRLVTRTAECSTQILNLNRLAREIGVSAMTVRRWLWVLEASYLAERVEPFWTPGRLRLVRTAKILFADSGLMAHLAGLRTWGEAGRRGLDAALLETWVHAHLRAFAAFAERAPEIRFFRAHYGPAVDFVLVWRGRQVPVSIRGSATLREEDAGGLRAFLALAKKESPFGILLYAGEQALPFGEGVAAVPLGSFLGGSGGA